MRRIVKKTCKFGGEAAMLGMFWVGTVLIGAAIAINYTIHKQKSEDSCSKMAIL